MNKQTKQFTVAMMIAAATISGLKAGSTSQNEEVTPAPNGPDNVSLTVEGELRAATMQRGHWSL